MEKFLEVYLNRFFKLTLVGLIISSSTITVYADTYDWIGATSTDVTLSANWYDATTAGILGGVPGAADDVRIAVNSTYGLIPITLTNFPVVTANTTWKSITFGFNGVTSTSYTYGQRYNISLTVNTGTLTVTGNITQNHNKSAQNTPYNYILTSILGTGTLICQGNLIIGDATTQPDHEVADVAQVSSQITQLTINGNIILNSNGNGITTSPNQGICYPWFSLDKGMTTLLGQVTFATHNSPLLGGFVTYNPGATVYTGYGLFTADYIGSTANTLELKNKLPIVAADNFYVYFTKGGNTGTTLYDDATAENQTIYTANEPSVTTTATYINTSSPAYFNLTFSGVSVKVVDKNSTLGTATQGLTTGGRWTTGGGAVNLNTNNPTVAIGGNWINSTTVTQGSGDITVARSLTNNSGGVLSLGTANLFIGGGYTNNVGGVYTQGTGTTSFNGTGAQALVDNSTTGTIFKKVNFSGGGTATMGLGTNNVNFIVSNTGVLTMSNNSGLVAGTTTASYLTLVSDINSTASVAAIPTGCSITGNVNVQRYFKAQGSGTTADVTRNYRLLSSAVNNGNGGYDLAYLNNNPGIFVSGPTGPAGGFTVLNATPTMYLYNESLPASPSTFSGGTFKGITNIKTGNIMYYSGVGNNLVSTALSVLPVGNGIMLYYVGDNVHNVTTASALNKQSRFNGNYIAPDASTTTATGALNQGSIPVKLWWNGSTTLSDAIAGYNLVGNPYASSIDWDRLNDPSDIVGTNISPTIYVYNYMTRNYGSYQSGMSGGLGTNNATHIIASGQGFFVKAVAKTGASLTFNEGAKTAVQPNNVGGTVPAQLLLGTPVATAPAQLLRVKLAKDSVDTDDVIILFEAASKNTYERNVDADRLAGIGNVSTLASYSSDSTNKPLAINHMHSIDSTTRIRLYVNVSPSTAVDTLSGIGFETLDQHYDAYLVDHYKKDSLLFSKYQKYLFNISNADTNTYGFYRFELVFHKKSGLGYKLLTFTGMPVKEGVQLTWTTYNEQNLTNFQIERADGSKVFASLSSMQSNGYGTYTYLDKSPLAGINNYRLQQKDVFGDVSYSDTISVNINTSNSISNNTGIVNETLSLYPNPASSQFSMTITTDVPTTVGLRITNSMGQTIIYREMGGNNIQQTISNLLPGNYLVEVTDKATQKVIGVKKLIKQ
jgi:hypothetical protein